jgi:hypothetical protein
MISILTIRKVSMTPTAILAFLKYWLPVVSAFVLVIKGYISFSERVSAFADKFMANHMAHVQLSLDGIRTASEATAAVLLAHSETLEGIRTDSRLTVGTITQVQGDLKDHEKSDDLVQQKILTSLEVLRDRQQHV